MKNKTLQPSTHEMYMVAALPCVLRLTCTRLHVMISVNDTDVDFTHCKTLGNCKGSRINHTTAEVVYYIKYNKIFLLINSSILTNA